jgi:ankyrin repeat protein
MVRFLVTELGANVDQARTDGCTALYVAAEKGLVAVVLLLVKELGAHMNQASHKGCTPLYMAAREGHKAVVLCLGKELDRSIRGGTPARSTLSGEAPCRRQPDCRKWQHGRTRCSPGGSRSWS